MKLWLLRHARVELESGFCYGATDVPANAAFTLQAAEAAAALLPPGLPVWVSGLGRAQQLALELSTLRPDLGDPAIDTRLNEMDFGHWELQRWDAIPRAAFDVWMADFAHHRFGGVESTQMVLYRVAAALGELRPATSTDVLWITHAGVIRAASLLHARPDARPLATDWPAQAPACGGWHCLDWPLRH